MLLCFLYYYAQIIVSTARSTVGGIAKSRTEPPLNIGSRGSLTGGYQWL